MIYFLLWNSPWRGKSWFKSAKLCSFRLSWNHIQRVHVCFCDFIYRLMHKPSIAWQSLSSAALFSILHNPYFFKYIAAFFFFEMIAHLILEEHITLNGRLIEVFVVSSNWVICQMNKFVTYLLWIVIYCRKTNITLIVHPNHQRVEICH